MKPTWRARQVVSFAGRHVRDLVSGHGDASGGRQVETSEQVEQGGLAGPAGAHEGDEIARVRRPGSNPGERGSPRCRGCISYPGCARRRGTGRSLFRRCSPSRPPSPHLSLTRWPSRSSAGPSTTTLSPGARPAVTCTSPPIGRPGSPPVFRGGRPGTGIPRTCRQGYAPLRGG